MAVSAQVDAIRLNDPAALPVIRHSTAHVMADAVQRLFPGTKVTFGPAVENGFYYDFDRKDGQFTDEDFERIEGVMREIIAADHPFRREVVTRDAARSLLASMGETYKVEHLERLEGEISLYRHGDWVDLCEGPHVPSTGFLRAVKLTSVAGAYWRGDERNPMLQRIYGTAFPSEKELRSYLQGVEEAKRRDHRKLGKELELFMFHRVAPAMPFFLPRGAEVYNRLVEYVRELYRVHGYEEVITPQIFDASCSRPRATCRTIGEHVLRQHRRRHAARGGVHREAARGRRRSTARAARASMRFGVKPMNCPGHCLIFGMTRRSYRELPWRVADFGRLHRYERGGVVHGLARVRTFAQDDAHIFCTPEQMQGEIDAFLDLVLSRSIATSGSTDVRIEIATRPEKRMGADEVWDRAEAALEAAVKQQGLPFEIAPGEGAFYGPSSSSTSRTRSAAAGSSARSRSTSTCPSASSSRTSGDDNAPHRPVMLHRAILGSLERFFGVLHRARRRRVSDLARARAGRSAHREREGQRLRRRGDGIAAPGRNSRDGGCFGRQAGREDPQCAQHAHPVPGGARRARSRAARRRRALPR